MRKGRPGPAPPWWPSYLFATLSDGGRELTDYHIHTLDTGLFELLHLLFHCGFKSEVRCEEARPAPGEEEGTGGEAAMGRGGRRKGSESQAEPGFRSGGWHRHGGKERDTDTEKERTEDNVSVGPALPTAPQGRHLLGVARYLEGFCGYGAAEGGGEASEGPTPCSVQGPLLSSDPLPKAWCPPPPATLSRPSLSFLMLSLSQP